MNILSTAISEKTDTSEKSQVLGRPLIVRLNHEMQRRQLNTKELATLLGLSRQYLIKLMTGKSAVEKVKDETFNKIAKFLAIPKAEVYCLAEILTPADFVHNFKTEDLLAQTFKSMRQDPVWMAYAPSEEELKALPRPEMLKMAVLYQTMTYRRFMEAVAADASRSVS